MELVLKLVTVCAVATLSTAQLNYNNPVYVPEYIQTQSSYVEALQQPPTDQQQETANFNFQQLPKPDAPKPFYTVEPQLSTVLKAPTEDAGVTNFNSQNFPSVPSQELELPSQVNWNPNDDPNLYYPVPVVVDKIVPLDIPTNLYPKKYNKNNQKEKNPVLKLKALVDDTASRQDPLKALYSIAKQDNRNLLKLEKTENLPSGFQSQKVNDPLPAASGFGSFSSPSHGAGSLGGLTHEPFTHGAQGHGAGSLGGLTHEPFTHGAQGHGAGSLGGLTHEPFTHSAQAHEAGSLGGLAHDHAPFIHGAQAQGVGGHAGERMEFHVSGHNGPKSYKWGYDTGKGHNRHFRYEERDNHGFVKGHYGYHDKHGNLRMIHYDADPHEGFHASDGDIGHN